MKPKTKSTKIFDPMSARLRNLLSALSNAIDALQPGMKPGDEEVKSANALARRVNASVNRMRRRLLGGGGKEGK